MFGLASRPRRSSPRARRFRPVLECLEEWVLPASMVFTVTSTADTVTGGTLRQALLNANANLGLDTIDFDIPGSGVHSIDLQSALPVLTDPIVIDATSQPGYAGSPLIQLDGALAGANVAGLWITAGASTVKGLSITRFGGSGINLQTNGNNFIQANFIGTDPTGTLAEGNLQAGLVIFAGSAGNQIVQNVISANGADGGFPGLSISDTGSNNNVVAGNLIGVNATGTTALGNAGDGILLSNGVQGTLIGTNGDGVNDTAERNVVSGNTLEGIAIQGSLTNSNIVAGNYIGTNKNGTAPLANGSNGLSIFGGAKSNRVGTNGSDVDAVAEGNLISGNAFSGVFLGDVGTNGNIVAGNLIGTDLTGTKAVANRSGGIDIAGGAQSNRVGTNGDGLGDALERNVISGNNIAGSAGVFITDNGTNQNLLTGNFIGTDITGSKALGNGGVGVFIANGAQSNRIGSDGSGVGDAAERNIISGNAFQGVAIQGSGTNLNVVAGNYIGVAASGTIALGNQNNGIWILQGAQSNRIGTNGTDADSAGEANIIGGNGLAGIRISDPGSNQNLVAGNFIGSDKSGAIALGNGDNGITVANGAQSNQIGGSRTLANVIAFNHQTGVAVLDTATLHNSIRANAIYSNTALGIDLGWDGVTTNNAGNVDVGPNGLQNYPVLLAASPGATTAVSGTLNSKSNTTFTLDFYASPTPDPTFFGQGQRFLGSLVVTTDAAGNASFSGMIPAGSSVSEWISATATDPLGNTSEFSGSRRLPTSAPALSASTWTAIGPSPTASEHFFNGPVVSGRVSVAVGDPTNANIMYLGADGGGVWKTTDWLDPSPVWVPLTDSQPSLNFNNLSYNALAVFPGNPSMIFAAMSGPGGGVLRSTDGGNSWTLLGNALFDRVNFGSIAINPTDSNTIYVSVWGGSTPGGVYKSTDGGLTWSNTTASVHTGAASDIVMDPTNPAVLYAGLVQGANGGITNGVYKTTNAGLTWARLSNGILTGSGIGISIRLALAPSVTTDVYATVFDPALGNAPQGMPHRYKSMDGGSTWSALSPLPALDESRYWHIVLSVDPTHPFTVYVNGGGPLYRSTDGGATWTSLYSEDPVDVSFDKNAGVILVGDRGIYRWAGPGNPFANKQGNLQNGEFYTLTLDPTNPSVAYGIAQDQFNGLKYSGIPVWNNLSGAEETGKILIDPTNPAVLYEYDPESSTSFVFKSTDGGIDWVPDGSGIPTMSAGFGLAYTSQKAFVMDAGNSQRLIVGVSQVYESTNGGALWKAISPVLSAGQFITALAIAPSHPSTIYAATADGRFFVTQNDGGLWSEIDTGLPLGRGITSIQVDPANPNRAFIVPGTFPTNVMESTHVWMTTSGGASWTEITGNLPADNYTNSIAVDWRFSTPMLYVGTARGIYQSANLGGSWSTFSNGLPNVVVTDLQFVPGLNILGAATYGRGVFEILVPGPGPHFQVSVVSSVTAGSSLSFVVSALDGNNNLLSGYLGTVHFTSSDGNAVLPDDYTFTAADHGLHVFSGLSLRTAGKQTLVATDTVTDTILGSASVTVKAGAAVRFTVSGFPSPTTAGVSHGFSVAATDSFGNIATGYSGSIHFTSSDAKALLPANYTFSGSDQGVHAFSATLKTAGMQSLSGMDVLISGTTGTQLGITVNPSATTGLLVTGFPSAALAGSTNSIVVTARDIFGNKTPGYRGTVHFTSSDRLAVLPGNYTFVAGDNGVHVFSATLKTAAMQSITAADTLVITLKGSQAGIVINAAATSQLAVAGLASPIVAGTTGAFAVIAKDAFGNITTSYVGTVFFTSSDNRAILPANYTFLTTDAGKHVFSATVKTASSQSISATDTMLSTITGKQTFTVSPAAAKTFFVFGYASPTIAGVSHVFTVAAIDPFGNIATSYQGTVHFTSSDSQAVLPMNYTFLATDHGKRVLSATLKTAGSQSITATDTVTSSVTGTRPGITVNPAAVSTLQFSGSSAFTIGVPRPITITAKDVFRNIVTGYLGTIRFTSSDPAATLPANYTFTSLDAGKHTFFVAFGTAGSQSITVTDTVTATITGTLSGINVTFAMFGEPPPSQDADADPTDASRDLPDGDVPSPRAVLLANAVLSPLPGGISIQEEVGTAALALLLTAGRMDRRRCNKRTRSD